MCDALTGVNVRAEPRIQRGSRLESFGLPQWFCFFHAVGVSHDSFFRLRYLDRPESHDNYGNHVDLLRAVGRAAPVVEHDRYADRPRLFAYRGELSPFEDGGREYFV